MTTAPDSYQPPVNRLLELGDPREEKRKRDYLALGLGAEHVPDLIRMAQDDSLNTADSESLEVWAPLHAWRTLGQLRAEAAIEPLLGLLHRIDDNNDDSVGEDLPEVFGQIGPAAIGPLEQYAASSQNPTYARAAAAGGLRQIGKQHPGARDAAVAALTRLLDNYAEPGRDPGLNGFLTADLLALEAAEAAPSMQRAFAAGVVEEGVAGDWEDVQIELGLKEQRDTPRPDQFSEIRETMRLLDQLGEQPSKPAKEPASAKPPKPVIVPPPVPSGPKRKHHRRKK